MYQEPNHIFSSYVLNNIGHSIYNTTRTLKPRKVVDFGILYGYSTICLAQAVRDNEIGHVYALDLFEDYKYRHSIKSVVEHNLEYYGLTDYVTLVKKSFDEWLNESWDFDLLHLDISNDGDVVDAVYKKYPDKAVIFEGGIAERDNVEWMIEHNATPILNSKAPFTVLNNNFPGISGYNI
tara:strand:+ start:26 stop:565 length:540 start_codon:yes stop_codon:yes gene_type:complete